MAKTIKFNLICNGNPVRTIEDLQDNFSAEDVLAYYNNKLLHRWLEVRGYSNELEKVSSISSAKPLDIIKELIGIFNISDDKQKIEEDVYIFEFIEERKTQFEIYREENFKVEKIVYDYIDGYKKLVERIYENPRDAAIIKATIIEIAKNYKWAIELNHRELFNKLLKDKSVLAIMCLLMNENTRNYYLPDTKTQKDGTTSSDTMTSDKKQMFDKIKSLILLNEFYDKLGDNLIVFSGDTDGYWKDLEPKGKKYMIISMGKGDYVRPAGVTGGDLSQDDILNSFVIVDGVDYKSNSTTRKLRYMEV